MNAILKFRVLFILFLSVLAGCDIIDMNVKEYLCGKPRYQELTIRYHFLGWDPKRERFFFIKTLTEYRDFKWEAEESRYVWHWYPEATNVQYIVCAVSEDGTNLKELYALPQNQLRRVESRLDKLIQGFTNSSPVLSDGSIIQLIGDNFIRISTRGVEELAKVSAGVLPKIEVSPSGKNVLIVSRFNKDRSKVGMYIANLETGSLDHCPIPEIIHARWSPDSKKVAIVAGNLGGISPAGRRIEIFDLQQKPCKAIFEIKLPGAGEPKFEWTRDNTIWLTRWDTRKPEISSDIFTVKEAPGLWESKKYFTGQLVKELRHISLGVMDYEPAYPARMGPPRVFGLVTKRPYGTNELRVLRVKHEEQEENAVSEFETIFLLPGRKIHVSEKQRWDDVIKAESDSSGALW